MGPVIETFLSFVLPVLFAIAVLGFVFRQQIRRLVHYFQAWQARDERLDAEERACQAQARQELEDEAKGVVLPNKSTLSDPEQPRTQAQQHEESEA